jgi:hypothetical protein
MGITGVIDDTTNICLSIARIFPDSGQGASQRLGFSVLRKLTHRSIGQGQRDSVVLVRHNDLVVSVLRKLTHRSIDGLIDRRRSSGVRYRMPASST